MNISTSSLRSGLLLLGAATTFAAPVTTVPWNGYPGAVSLTYDDARNTQLPNLIPQLDQLGVKATFFITNMYSFPGSKSKWTDVAKNGHELGNHTSDHNPPNTSNVSTMASTLRGMDPSVDAVTFAYPNCSVTGTAAVEAESFMGRGCADTKYDWGSQPSNWMNIQGQILGSSSVGNGVAAINAAKSNKWVITIVHDVGPNPDQYSLTVADNKKLLDAATSNKLWIAPYGTVGAYYKAHFTMDKVTPTKNGSNWDMKWTSPHAKMPKVVKLRIKLDAGTFGSDITVKQGGTAIAAESDGSYVIDFMKLAMTVEPKSTGVQARASLPGIRTSRTENGIKVSGLDRTMEASVVDVRGASLFRGAIADGIIPVGRSSGFLFLDLKDPASGLSFRKRIDPAL
jgi:hypothetical protein